VVLIAAPLVWFLVPGRRDRTEAAERLYATALDDVDGHRQRLAQWRGRYLVVNFWATWCAPCVAEMPELDRLQSQYAQRNIVIVGIGIDGPEQIRQFRDRLALRMPLLVGGFDALSLAREFGDNQGVLPYTVLLSADGAVLHQRTGALVAGEMRQWLDGLPPIGTGHSP